MKKSSKKHPKKEVKMKKKTIKNRVEKKWRKDDGPGEGAWSGTFAFGPGGTTNQQDK